MAYDSTTVNVSRSQEQIRGVLRAHGASRIAFGESFNDGDADEIGHAGVEFVHNDTLVRFYVPIQRPSPKIVGEKLHRARSKTKEQIVDEMVEQEARRIWRVLHWSIKARMEALEEGIETFEQAFLAHIVDPASDRTLWEHIQPMVDAGAFSLGGPGLRALGAGSVQ